MDWFDEQIRQREKQDRARVEDTFFRMASAVMDKWATSHLENQLLIAQEALDDILKYFHLKSIEIPSSIKDAKRQMEYVIRPSGLMTREVILSDKWYRHASGPMLGHLKDRNISVALLPGFLTGYYFKDPATGKQTRVTRKTARLFSQDALCFYQPLPMKKLDYPDLLLYMKHLIFQDDLILIALVTLAGVLVGILEPRIYSLITGVVLKMQSKNLLIGTGIFLLCSAFAAQMIEMMRRLLAERINTKTTIAVESSLMMRILSLPVNAIRQYSAAELASRIESAGTLCEMFYNSFVVTLLGCLMSLLYIIEIFRFSSALVLPSLIILLLIIIITQTASFMQLRVSKNKMEMEEAEKSMSFSIISGMQKIRMSGSEKRAFSRWGNLYARSAAYEYNPPVYLKLHTVLITAVTLVGTVVLYKTALDAKVTPSQYYAFSAAFGRITGAFLTMDRISISTASILPVLELLEPLLLAEPEVTFEKQELTRMTGNIEMSHVSFRYQKDLPYIFRNLSLKINAGEYVGIVGRTGCGKSTLVRLLLGFERPETGAIYYDQKDLCTLDLNDLRKKIGTVMQEAGLFSGDIYSNITISAPELSMDEVWEAAKKADIAEDIRRMPMGMHTFLSEGQGGISGGQKQRLLIARAIAPNPKILIFDEATSALDNKTQKRVSDSLDAMGCTRLIIAHRLSTIRHCDRILVIDDGNIIEEGTYDELMARNGLFAELAANQLLNE